MALLLMIGALLAATSAFANRRTESAAAQVVARAFEDCARWQSQDGKEKERDRDCDRAITEAKSAYAAYPKSARISATLLEMNYYFQDTGDADPKELTSDPTQVQAQCDAAAPHFKARFEKEKQPIGFFSSLCPQQAKAVYRPTKKKK